MKNDDSNKKSKRKSQNKSVDKSQETCYEVFDLGTCIIGLGVPNSISRYTIAIYRKLAEIFISPWLKKRGGGVSLNLVSRLDDSTFL